MVDPAPEQPQSEGGPPLRAGRSSAGKPRRSLGQLIVAAAQSLQCKGVVLLAFITLTVTATVAGYLLNTSAKLARRHQDEDIGQLAAMLAQAASIHIAEDDLESLGSLAEKAVNGIPLLYVFFVDAGGRELAGAQHPSIRILDRLRDESPTRPRVLGTPMFQSSSESGPATIDVTHPISIRRPESTDDAGPPTELIGYVRTGAAANAWYRSMSSRLDLMIGVGVLLALVAVPLSFLLIRRIVSPLESLTVSMLRFSQGELDIRSPVRRRDELGRLASAFNRMADKHQRTHERIVRLNSRLEERVAQRTQQLRELAAREPLTGLYNRRHFNEVLEQRLSEALRYGTDLSIAMIDLDDFKKVNDQYGHSKGDEVLMAVALTINSQLRSADLAARFGGDEFILMLPQTNAVRALVLATRMVEQFRSELEQRLPNVSVGLSVGIACLEDVPRRDSESLIRAADRALYQAKAAGKNQIVTAGGCLKTSVQS